MKGQKINLVRNFMKQNKSSVIEILINLTKTKGLIYPNIIIIIMYVLYYTYTLLT